MREKEAEAAERDCKILRESPPSPEENAFIGCGIMMVAAVLLSGLSALQGQVASTVRSPVGIILVLLMLGGWAILPAIRWARYRAQVDAAAGKAAAARRAAEHIQARIIADTPPDLAERIHALEQQVGQAEADKARLDEVLSLAQGAERG